MSEKKNNSARKEMERILEQNKKIAEEKELNKVEEKENEIDENLNVENLEGDEIDDDNYSVNEEILFDGQGENELVAADNIEEFREKVRKSGVIYISNIPEGMTVSYLRHKFETYGVTRIFLTPENPNIGKNDGSKPRFSKNRKIFKEGWVEFSSKLQAKLCEYELNGQVIGGKKNVIFREDIWTVKYLHKFKWHHLIEKTNFNRKLREQRMKAEIAQGRREANFIEQKFEQSKVVSRMNKKRERDEIDAGDDKQEENNEDGVDTRFSGDKFTALQRNFKQRKPIMHKK